MATRLNSCRKFQPIPHGDSEGFDRKPHRSSSRSILGGQVLLARDVLVVQMTKRDSRAHPSTRRAGKLSHPGSNVKSPAPSLRGGVFSLCAGREEVVQRMARPPSTGEACGGRWADWWRTWDWDRRAGCADFAARPLPAPRCDAPLLDARLGSGSRAVKFTLGMTQSL